MYRIIEVFEGQMKLIYWGPSTAVGQFYQNANFQFDPNSSEGGHGEHGYNDWAQAKLQTTLNTTYWNTIPLEYQNMVDQNHVWNIGGQATTANRSTFYEAERSNTISSIMSSATWTGKVGLMYPSDYGYATNGTSCDTDMNQWRSEGTGSLECYGVNSNWLINTAYHQWTMSPYTYKDSYVFYVATNGQVTANRTSLTNLRVRPTLYLKSNVKITGGSGTSSAPYQLSL